MEKALSYAIGAGIVAFGGWILYAGLSSGTPILWGPVALIPIAVGVLTLSEIAIGRER
jgi:hypothetical protein